MGTGRSLDVCQLLIFNITQKKSPGIAGGEMTAVKAELMKIVLMRAGLQKSAPSYPQDEQRCSSCNLSTKDHYKQDFEKITAKWGKTRKQYEEDDSFWKQHSCKVNKAEQNIYVETVNGQEEYFWGCIFL